MLTDKAFASAAATAAATTAILLPIYSLLTFAAGQQDGISEKRNFVHHNRC